jgi:hypothetical protein
MTSSPRSWVTTTTLASSTPTATAATGSSTRASTSARVILTIQQGCRNSSKLRTLNSPGIRNGGDCTTARAALFEYWRSLLKSSRFWAALYRRPFIRRHFRHTCPTRNRLTLLDFGRAVMITIPCLYLFIVRDTHYYVRGVSASRVDG